MEQITFYKYFINLNKCQIVQYKAIGIKAGNGLYLADFFNADNKQMGNSRFVRLRNFEQIHSFRIFSFNDDLEHYKHVLLDKYAEMIKQNKANVQRQEQFLERLKSQN